MTTTARSVFPAPDPVSAMAGVTRPRIRSGTMKRSICPNTPLKALTTLRPHEHGAYGWPSSQPSAVPPIMAMRIFPKSPSFIFRMPEVYQIPM